MTPPLIGITADLADGRFRSSPEYAAAVESAGGWPVILPCNPESIDAILERCDGIVLSGGDDPAMEPWGVPTHPRATPIHPARQAFEVGLLRALDARPDLPALGICLGMQLMGLVRGARLEQHLPDVLDTADVHWGRRLHPVDGALGAGDVHSNHRQALTDPGELEVAARAPDGVIEAVLDPRRPFHVGVQWHPERTADPRLGRGLFEMLVAIAKKRNQVPFSNQVRKSG